MKRWFRNLRAMKRWGLGVAAGVVAFTMLGAPQTAHAMPIPPVYGGVPVIVDPLIPANATTGPAYGPLGGPVVFRVNPIRWAQMPEGAQQFTLDHELGHAVTVYPYPVSQNQKEWDADTFATLAMMRRGQGALIDQEIVYMQQLAASGFQLSSVYAPFPVMIAHLQAVKAQYRATHP